MAMVSVNGIKADDGDDNDDDKMKMTTWIVSCTGAILVPLELHLVRNMRFARTACREIITGSKDDILPTATYASPNCRHNHHRSPDNHDHHHHQLHHLYDQCISRHHERTF